MSGIWRIVFDSTEIVLISVASCYKRSLETARMSRSSLKHARRFVKHAPLSVVNTITIIAKSARKCVRNVRKRVVSSSKTLSFDKAFLL